jgi:hypothetical protein
MLLCGYSYRLNACDETNQKILILCGREFMAESGMDAQTDTKSEDTEKKSSTRRPAKKRPIKNVAKKPVKKARATKTDGDDENKKTSSRPSKKSVVKKSAKRTTKPEGEDGGRTVISRRPPKKRVVQDAASQSGEALQEEPKKDMIVQSESQPGGARGSNVGEAPQAESRSEEPTEGSSGIQWGRRAKKSGPVGWEEKVPVSKGTRATPPSSEPLESKPLDPPKSSEPVAQVSKAPTPQSVVPQETPHVEETPNVSESTGDQAPPRSTEVVAESAASPVQAESSEAEARKDQAEQDSRRGRSRGGRNNNRGRRGRGRNDNNDNSERPRNEDARNRPDDNPGRNEDQQVPQPVEDLSASLMELLAVSWTEEKTREYLNEGVLARLSPGLVEGNGESIKDIGALKEPLKAIRRVLADECMVADDVADIMLLDVVMGALADRIEVCLLQAKPQSLQDMNVLLDMRCKADKRLMEAVGALKNA